MSESSRNRIIKTYFYKGYTYETIREFLYAQHGISISLRHLKRVLHNLRLRRRNPLTRRRLLAIIEAISKELQGSGSLLGYRQLWRRVVQKYKLPISRYSRKIIWLKVGTTNNKPSVIARYFIDSVLKLKGAPSVLRCDLGTENTYLSWIQPFLRQHHVDSLSSTQACFRYGKSVSNQRIEAWWSILKRWNMAWWINLFKGLQAKGLFDETDPLQLKCLRLAFMDLLQKELDEIVVDWNSHYVRKQRHLTSPCGIPEKLFNLPELYGARNQLKLVRVHEAHYIRDKYTEEPPTPADVDFLRQARCVIHQYNMSMPTNVKEAIKFYINLWTILENE